MKRFIDLVMFVVIPSVWLAACGQGVVQVDQSTYAPKIVINGLIYPDERIDRIKITRNFPINTTISFDDEPLTEALVIVSDENGVSDTLVYNPLLRYFQSQFQKVRIGGGKTYQLNVFAEIDGRRLSASAQTTVPEKGFKINEELSCLGNIPYRRYYVNGLLASPCINFNPSQGVAFYALSGTAMDVELSDFIEQNMFGVKKDIVEENFNAFKNFSLYTVPTKTVSGTSKVNIPWWYIYFYGRYRVIMYAGDINFYHFFVTHRFVQNFDGNLRDPLFHIEGDGIGLFGSAIRDTAYFHIIP